MKQKLSLYSYLDYRLFLKDWIKIQSEMSSRITFRDIAAQVGFNSPAHITMILKGKANLSLDHCNSFSKLICLSKKESEYFHLLVQFNQAKKDDDKKTYLSKLIKYRKTDSTTQLSADQYEYYQRWYYAAIHDILSFYKFKGDFSELAQMLEPSITLQQAKKAIKLLESLKFIVKSNDGGYVCNYPAISAYSDGRSLVLQSYAEVMIEKAKYALKKVQSDDRLISWCGCSVSEETFQKIKEEARSFRKKIIAMANDDKNPDRAIHLNLQIFPLSKVKKNSFDKDRSL